MLKGIIVEDEVGARLNLEHLLPNVSSNIEIVGFADSVETAASLIDKIHPDIVFMDIQIKGGSGFDVLQSVNYKAFKTIFVTAFEDYALKAFKFSATDYLLKPVDEDELKIAVEKVGETTNNSRNPELIEALLKNFHTSEPEDRFIVVNSIKSIDRFPLKDILYCESFRNYTTFHLVNNTEIVSSKSLKEYEDILDEKQFIRAHRSFIVNQSHIRKFDKEDGGFLVLANDKKVPVSQRKKEAVLKSLFK